MRILGIILTLAALGCATDVVYERNDDAPILSDRGNGCHVDVMELGRELEHQHPYKILGTLVWKLSREEIQRLGGEGVRQKIVTAACRHGLFVVTEITAYPNSGTGGATYEAKAGVLVDADGNPLNIDAAANAAADAGPKA